MLRPCMAVCVCSLCCIRLYIFFSEGNKSAKRFWLSLHCRRPIDLTNSSSFHITAAKTLHWKIDVHTRWPHWRNMDADSPNSSTLSIRAQFNFQFNFFLQGGEKKNIFWDLISIREYTEIFSLCVTRHCDRLYTRWWYYIDKVWLWIEAGANLSAGIDWGMQLIGLYGKFSKRKEKVDFALVFYTDCFACGVVAITQHLESIVWEKRLGLFRLSICAHAVLPFD